MFFGGGQDPIFSSPRARGPNLAHLEHVDEELPARKIVNFLDRGREERTSGPRVPPLLCVQRFAFLFLFSNPLFLFSLFLLFLFLFYSILFYFILFPFAHSHIRRSI